MNATCSTCFLQVDKNYTTNKSTIKTLHFCLLTTTKHDKPCKAYKQGDTLIIPLNKKIIDTNEYRTELCERFPAILKRAINASSNTIKE